MDYIRRSLDILQGKLPTDKNSFNHALKEIQHRVSDLKPLLHECYDKKISLKSLCVETDKEYNEILSTLRLIELLFNYQDSLKKSTENYNECKSVFNKGLMENNIHLVYKFKKELL